MLGLDYSTCDKSFCLATHCLNPLELDEVSPRSQGWSRGFQRPLTHLICQPQGGVLGCTCTSYKARRQHSVRIQPLAFPRGAGKALNREDAKLDGTELKGEIHHLRPATHHAAPSRIPEALSYE